MVDPTTYDNRRHAIPFEIGTDFATKWNAYIADGFFCSIIGNHIHVCKLANPNEPIPNDVVWH